MNRTRLTIHRIGAVLILSLCTSCARERSEPVDLESLPYLQRTHHPELRAEFSRLVAEQATPQLLSQATTVGGETVNTCAARLLSDLNAIYPAPSARSALESIDLFYPAGAFRFDPIKLEKARNVLERRAPQLAAYRKAFSQPDFEFHVSLSDGLLADLSVLDHAKLAHRLEALYAADALAGGEPAASLLALQNMLLIDARLAAVPSVAVRSTAASLRTEAYAVVAALAQHPRYTPLVHDKLLKTLDSQLERWTGDRVAWVGDRALGMHAYEMVRDGQLLSILTGKEIETLKGDGNLQAFDEAVLKSLDEDESFYLSAMRRAIDACDKPYYDRTSLFNQINREVTELRDTPRCPLLATHVLLPDLAVVQREFAIDQARCEVWVQAMRAAAGKPVDISRLNPVTGEPYELVREFDTIIVRHLTGPRDEETAVAIPMQIP